jgi:hypothetical protein
MSLLDWGINWLETVREEHLVEDVEVTLPGMKGVVLPATVKSSTTTSYQGRVKIQTTYFHFIFVTQSLVESGIPIDRGLQIRRQSEPQKVYELAYEGKAMFEYNDPNKKAIILYCVEKPIC